jgi:hypothetical protein
MTQELPSLHITDFQVTQVWERNPTTGHSEPGLAVTVTISWMDESNQIMTKRYSGSLTPKDA